MELETRVTDAGSLTSYWTVIVPYAPPSLATEWHPTTDRGPFAVLTRGAFPTEALAIAWAERHLGRAPYTTRFVEVES